MRKLLTIAIAVAAIGVLTAAPVAAAPPQQERFENTGSALNPALTEVCGTPIHESWTVRETFIGHTDGSILVRTNFTTTISGPGGSVQAHAASTIHGAPVLVVVDEEAGTVTESYTDRMTGLILQWRVTGSPPMRHLAGSISIDVTLVFDLETGRLLSEAESFVDIKGTYTPPDQSTMDALCDALT